MGLAGMVGVLGFTTLPPVVMAQVAGGSIGKMMKPLLVFIGVIFACLMVITYVPVIALFLPNTFLP